MSLFQNRKEHHKFPPVWQQIELTPVLALRESLHE